LTTTKTLTNLPAIPDDLGQIANQHARLAVFADFLSRKAENTIRNYRQSSELFEEYLADVGNEQRRDMLTNPQSWQGITWGLMEGFKAWMLKQGFAIGTLNGHLTHARKLATLAGRAGIISAEESAMIQQVKPYTQHEAPRIDEKREQTRIGRKKAEPVLFSAQDAMCFKARPDTPQGRRDRLIMCLLLEHGLRAGEVAILTIADVNLIDDIIRIKRPKVGKVQYHQMTADTAGILHAIKRAGEMLPAPDDPLVRRMQTRGLGLTGVGESGIAWLVGRIGEHCGISGLSPHDCRHFWASYWASRVNAFRLMEAGGWSNLNTVMRYVHAVGKANEGMTETEY
jgi:integrase